MSGSPGDVGNILAQALKMQKSVQEAQAELAAMRVEATAGGGAASATVDGMGAIQGVRLSDEAVASGDRAMLEEMVMAAIAEAQRKAKADHDERMAKVTGGLNLPGLL